MSREIPETLDVEIFRTGDYGAKGRFTEDDLDQLARDYSPAHHEAPVTLDHSQDGPADGWVSGLRRAGDCLVATLARLSPRLRALLAAGAYKKRSVELYRRFRDTARPYLKAVSFLGAAAPEVKGLADVAFAQGDAETVAFIEDSLPAEKVGTENTASADATAEDARRRLVDAQRWDPAWEHLGLLDVFRELGPGEALESLVELLSRASAPVAFGEAAGGEAVDALAGFNGPASPESIQRHRQALAYLAAHPSASYAEALLAAGS